MPHSGNLCDCRADRHTCRQNRHAAILLTHTFTRNLYSHIGLRSVLLRRTKRHERCDPHGLPAQNAKGTSLSPSVRIRYSAKEVTE